MQGWGERTFGLANEAVLDGLTPLDNEWLQRPCGLDVSSPRYKVTDNEEAFEVALDVPGVNVSEININVVDENDDGKILTIEGQREMSDSDGVSRVAKFSKSFALDSSIVNTDNITATLNNGVVFVSVPKDLEKIEKKTRKIPVVVVADEGDSIEVDKKEAN